MVPAPISDDKALVHDLALVAAEVLTVEEAAARAGLAVDDVLSRFDDPDLMQRVEAEAVRLKLTGATGQAKATALRDKLLVLLAAKVDGESTPRVLIDALNVVKGIAAREDDTKAVGGFSLNIIMPGAGVPVGQVVDMVTREVGGTG